MLFDSSGEWTISIKKRLFGHIIGMRLTNAQIYHAMALDMRFILILHLLT
jgi:hypothetical protein